MKTLIACCLALMLVASAFAELGTVETYQQGLAKSGRDGNNLDVPGDVLRTIFSPDYGCFLGVSVAVDCRGTLYYTEYCVPMLYFMDAFGTPLGSKPTVDAAGTSMIFDELSWDEGRQMLWTANNNNIYLLDPFALPNAIGYFQFVGQAGISLTDGISYDGVNNQLWHSPDVSSYITCFDLPGGAVNRTLVPLDGSGNPDLSISGICIGTGNSIYVGHNGLGYITRNNSFTGLFGGTFAVPGGRDEGLECDAINFAPTLALWTKGAYDRSFTAFEVESGTCACAVLPDTCDFYWQEVDHGDLVPCNYPTLMGNPAHALTGIAWLGPMVDGLPPLLNIDNPTDDGVFFSAPQFMPCGPASVTVFVSTGPLYPFYQERCHGHLYLNAWKDGNLDGDFCDRLPCGGFFASEWIIQDAMVFPGPNGFTYIDPGVFNMGTYDGVYRFRLTSTPVGRFGFGLMDVTACSTMTCGTFAFDILGEVEDYIIEDGQLAVNLSSFSATASADAITLNWTTASEENNDRFEIVRNDAMVGQMASQGNGAEAHNYTFVDRDVIAGTTYDYVLVAVDVNGVREELGTRTVTMGTSGSATVSEYALYQNYPNPFNPSTHISFDLVEAGFASLKVYNLMGQDVATVVNGSLTAGRHVVDFDASNLPSGVYVYRLSVNGFAAENKMLLMK